MKKNIHFLGLLLLAFFAVSCDKIEAPYIQQQGGGGGGTNPTKRKVLVEEFTGFTCKNCPAATKFLHQIIDATYKENTIVVAVHAGDLARPIPAQGYTEDYRVLPGADQLFSDFQMSYVPVALINRVPNDLAPFYEKEQWAGALAAQTAGDAEASIAIASNYNSANRQLNITVSGKYLLDATDNEYLNVYLVEKEVIGKQDSAGIEIDEYEHKDMLRAFINGKEGDKIQSTQLKANDTFTKQYTYTIPEKYNVNKCAVVAFVRNFDTKAVRQAEEALILP
jgi:subtilisin family serine protease